MKEKVICLGIALTLLLGLGLMTQPASAQAYGPWANNLLVHLYLNADAEFVDFEAGLIDIIDWPLTKYWIDKWTGNPDITMRPYAQAGKREFDINCQRWPTGITLPRVYDPKTKTYKHYDNYANEWDQKARSFRTALAYLSDKDGYIDRVLKGYGYRMDTTLPYPFLGGYVNLDVSGLNYPYRFNPAQAAIVLTEAGFTQGSTPNPYYPADPEGWEAQYVRTDPKGDWSVGGAGTDLKPLLFYIRQDDPERTDAGKELGVMMQKSGIPVDLLIRDRPVCNTQVMYLYDFHLYTGGWGLGTLPTNVYTLHHSARYWGGTVDSYYGGKTGSANYNGYCNAEYDGLAEIVYFSTDVELMKAAVKESQVVYVRDCNTIDLWSAAAFEAYRSKWTGLVNMEGFGTDNAWSFFNMKNTVGDTTIDWGFKSSVEGPHIFKSQWTWDRNLIGLVYEGMNAFNPYNYAIDEEVGTTCDFENPQEVGTYSAPNPPYIRSYVKYNLRDDVYFHNGRHRTPYDTAFGLILFRDVGPGIYWYHSSVAEIDYIEIKNKAPNAWALAHPHKDIRENTALGDWEIKIYLKVASMWARFWLSNYEIDSYLWLKANDKFGWNFGGTTTYYDTGSGSEAKGVVAYQPWVEDADGNGKRDMYDDGTNEWVMDGDSGGTAGTWTWVNFHAFRTPTDPANHYWTQAFMSNFINLAFHGVGNVNYAGCVNTYDTLDLVIDINDGSFVRNAYGAIPIWPHGKEFEQWNVDCDFDSDSKVFAKDLFLWGNNYGRISG